MKNSRPVCPGASRIGAAYIRVSTDGQMDLSPESQLDEILKYAGSHGITIPEQYIFMESEGRSGKKAGNRPRFQEMIAAAKTVPRPFDCILVWKFSRFARNQDESTFYKGMLRKRLGIDVISISEPVLDGMYGRLIEMIIEWQDEFYSYNLAQDVTRGMKTKAKNGGCQCRPPLGYRISRHNSIPEIVPEEAAVVRLIFEKYTLEHLSLYALTKYLNGLGLKTSRGNPFEKRSLEYILQNPIYTGMIRWNRTCHETGEIKDPSQWILAPGCHPAIITNDLFFLAGKRLKEEHRQRHQKPAELTKHWLGGLVKCSACLKSLSSCARKNASGSVTYSFQCSAYLKGSCRKNQYISERNLVPAVLESLNSLSAFAPAVYERSASISADASSVSASDTIKNRLIKLDRAEERIKAAYREGVDSLEEYRKHRDELNSQRHSLENALSHFLSCPQPADAAESNPTGLPDIQTVQNISEILRSDLHTTPQKNTALKTIISRIVFDRETLTISIFYRLSGTNTHLPSG